MSIMTRPLFSRLSIFLIVITLLCFCTSCNKQDVESPDDIYIDKSSASMKDDDSFSFVEGVDVEFSDDSLSSMEDTDPFGNKVTSFAEENMPYFPLVAMIQSEGIYLYGIKEGNGMILFQNEKGTYFDWQAVSPPYVLPSLMTADFEGDGEKELAVILNTGGGTNVITNDLHILKGTVPTEFVFRSTDAYQIISEIPIAVVVAEDSKSFKLSILGKHYTIDCREYFDDGGALTDVVNDSHITWFEFEENQIRFSVNVGAIFENIASVQSFGTIEAYVIFNKNGFSLDSYSFFLNLESSGYRLIE